MAYDKYQFKSLIERVLSDIGMNSPSAVNLLLGTAAQESRFGTYLKQLGNGPAIGAFQVEPFTFNDLKERYRHKSPWIADRDAYEMEWDLRLSIRVCRLKYWSCSFEMPWEDDLMGLARVWKKYYNTYLGRGTEEEFISNYRKYVE